MLLVTLIISGCNVVKYVSHGAMFTSKVLSIYEWEHFVEYSLGFGISLNLKGIAIQKPEEYPCQLSSSDGKADVVKGAMVFCVIHTLEDPFVIP